MEKFAMALYHRDVYLPKFIMAPIKGIKFSLHALDRLKYKLNLKPSDLPPIKVEFKNVVEVEILTPPKAHKVVFRQKLDKWHDICYVLLHLGDSQYLVKTFWINHKTDKHCTLDRTKYATA